METRPELQGPFRCFSRDPDPSGRCGPGSTPFPAPPHRARLTSAAPARSGPRGLRCPPRGGSSGQGGCSCPGPEPPSPARRPADCGRGRAGRAGPGRRAAGTGAHGARARGARTRPPRAARLGLRVSAGGAASRAWAQRAARPGRPAARSPAPRPHRRPPRARGRAGRTAGVRAPRARRGGPGEGRRGRARGARREAAARERSGAPPEPREAGSRPPVPRAAVTAAPSGRAGTAVSPPLLGPGCTRRALPGPPTRQNSARPGRGDASPTDVPSRLVSAPLVPEVETGHVAARPERARASPAHPQPAARG